MAPPPTDPGSNPAGEVCPQCGYSRTGLDATSPCPECGRVPVTATLPIDLADPLWLAQVRQGLTVVLVAWFIGAASVVGAIFVSMLTGRAGDIVFSLGALVASLVAARGWWRATDLESLARFEPPRPVVALSLRASMVGMAVGLGVGSIAADAARRLGHAGASEVLVQASLVAAGVSAMVHLSASMSFLGRIARAAGDATLARSCRQGVWAFPVALIIAAPITQGPVQWTGAATSALLCGLGLAFNVAMFLAGILTLSAPWVYAIFTWRTRQHACRALARLGGFLDVAGPSNQPPPGPVPGDADPGGAAC